MIVLVDLDGTVCDCSHRTHHVEGFEGKIPDEAWEKFMDLELVAQDTPVPLSCDVLWAMSKKGFEIIYLTARMRRGLSNNSDIQSVSSTWLNDYKYPYGQLWMRRRGDLRSNVDVKRDLTEDLHGSRDVVIIDDEPDMVQLAKEFKWGWYKAPECWPILYNMLCEEG